MARHTIPITNGKGSIELVTGTYNATAVAGGYDPSTLSPSSITIIDGTDTYAFTISAKGTLTLHVTDTGNPDTGVQIIGAKFVRTDSTGTITGTEISTNDDGNAVFNNVPFAASGSNKIYYKQISGDGGHTFDDYRRLYNKFLICIVTRSIYYSFKFIFSQITSSSLGSC